MSRTFGELLHALRDAVDRGADIGDLEDEIDHLAEFAPGTSRAAALAWPGTTGPGGGTGESMRLFALGKIGDPRDFPRFVAALDDPGLRDVALEGLGQQADRAAVDRVVRPLLAHPDPHTRSRAISIVAWCRQPGYLTALEPLTRDADRYLRWITATKLGLTKDPGAAPLVRAMLGDPDDGVRGTAARSLDRLDRFTRG